MKYAITLFLGLLLTISLSAQPKYWTGVNNNQWNNAANWNPTGIPTATDSVEIGNGGNVILTGNHATILKLTLTGNALLTIDDVNTSLNVFNSPNVGLHMLLSGDLVIAAGVLAISDSQGGALLVEDRSTIINNGIVSLRWFYTDYGLTLNHVNSSIVNNGQFFIGMSPGTNSDHLLKVLSGSLVNAPTGLLSISWCDGAQAVPLQIELGAIFENAGELNISPLDCMSQ